VAKLVAAAARAVDHARGRGILNGDLKSGNILLDRDEQPFLFDFGLAKWLHNGDSLTPTCPVIGTAAYVAPEQLAGGNAVTDDDEVYDLDAVLYLWLTCRSPFSRQTPFETERPVQPPEVVNPEAANSSQTAPTPFSIDSPRVPFRIDRSIAFLGHGKTTTQQGRCADWDCSPAAAGRSRARTNRDPDRSPWRPIITSN
jgi:serine/threonine protein kinase